MHISDLHLTYNSYITGESRKSFNQLMKSFKDEVQFLIITGDLTFAPKKAVKYKTIINNVNDLMNLLGIDKKHLIIVPGNHDKNNTLARKIITEQVLNSKNNFYKSTKGEIDDSIIESLTLSQSKFNKLYNELTGEKYSQKPLTKTIDNHNFLLLNTALFSYSSLSDMGKLIIGTMDLQNAISKIDNDYPTLVVGHHDLDWLNGDEKKCVIEQFNKINCIAYLCGHNHQFEIKDIKNAEWKSFICGAAIDDEDANGFKGDIGFYIGSYDDKKSILRTEAYYFDQKDRLWKTYPIFSKLQEDGIRKTVDYYEQYNICEIKKKMKEYLRVILNGKCNFSCPYCHKEGLKYISGHDYLLKSNSDFDITQLFENAKRKNIKKIKFTGGEPLLYDSLIKKCIEHLPDFDFIGILTNGYNLTENEDVLKDLNDSLKKKFRFTISLNTLDKEKYKKITGNVNSDIDKLFNGIDMLEANNIDFKFNTLVTKYNIDEIQKIIKYAVEKNADVNFLTLLNSTEISAPKIEPVDLLTHVSKDEIKKSIENVIGEIFKEQYDGFYAKYKDITILIPKPIYHQKCDSAPCEQRRCLAALNSIRVFNDYSMNICYADVLSKPGLDRFTDNINTMRERIENTQLNIQHKFF